MEIECIDFSTAYLNGEIDKDVYMHQPEGFEEGDLVCKLGKGLYGLKQGGRLWYKKLAATLVSMGFRILRSDNSVYVLTNDIVTVIIPVFVDDCTLVSKSKEALQKIKQELLSHFKLRDLGPIAQILGVQVTRDRSKRTLCLSQSQYAMDVLTKFNMADCKPVGTPMDPGVRLTKDMCPTTDAEREEMASVPYINAVGALMYLATATRPDIANAVSILARFSSNPGQQHWTAVKHLMRYIRGTLDMKLTYSPSSTGEFLTVYSDANYAAGKSTSAYVLKIGTGAVTWSSKLQTLVSLSTTEAEFVAAVSCR